MASTIYMVMVAGNACCRGPEPTTTIYNNRAEAQRHVDFLMERTTNWDEEDQPRVEAVQVMAKFPEAAHRAERNKAETARALSQWKQYVRHHDGLNGDQHDNHIANTLAKEIAVSRAWEEWELYDILCDNFNIV